MSTPLSYTDFILTPGTHLLRKELHDQWGGRRQGGISPSSTTPNIFIFWSPAVGEQHGYYDEFREDGCFYYTGAGQYGDQQLRDANRVLLNHVEDGRRVHLFSGHGGEVEYVTELVIDAEEPYYETEAPETGNGPLRRVFVFKFHPMTDEEVPATRSKLDGVLDAAVAEVPIENRWTEKFFVNPSAEEYEAERREQKLVLDLEAYLRRNGRDAARLKIVPTGERRPIFCDLYDKTSGVLIEAKGTVARDDLRMAIGQLMDYRRFARPGTDLAILLPERPRSDLMNLLESVDIHAIWPEDDRFNASGLKNFPVLSPPTARRLPDRSLSR
jgi:hypothetical protein